MRFLRKPSKFIKLTSITLITSGAGWIYYQIRATQDIFNNALDTSILPLMELSLEKNSPHHHNDDDVLLITSDSDRGGAGGSHHSLFDSLKLSFARRLLNLARSDNKFICSKSISQLARIKFSDHWHFSLLANMIDAHTAVRLARIENVNLRFFMEPVPHYANHTQTMIVEAMKDLLVELNDRSEHPCMSYFIARTFVDPQDLGRLVEHDIPSVELKKFIQTPHEILPICLESLLHHASIEKYARDIVEHNGLTLLMEIYKRYKHDAEISVKLCRIMSYISLYPDLLEDVHKSGWIGVLAAWVNHDDIRISIPAIKTLANFDHDDSIYSHRLYLLHPTTYSAKRIEADVIFVHGLLGGVFFTWRQRDKERDTLGLIGKIKQSESMSRDNSEIPLIKSRKISDPNTINYIKDLEAAQDPLGDMCDDDYEMVLHDIPMNASDRDTGSYSCVEKDFQPTDDYYSYCWPRDWLPDDCNNLRIIGINYDTNLSQWAPMCPTENITRTLQERSHELIYHLLGAGLGKRPIIWVTHSMGGLIVKNLLCEAFDSENAQIREICLKTKGIVFYSTPHLGSRVATMNQASSMVFWPSAEVQELKENSPDLLNIHNKFLSILDHLSVTIVSFVETKPTIFTALKFKFLFVEPHSGNPGVGEYYEIPLDHLEICKPTNRQSFLYQKVLHLIKDVLANNKSL